ncbi:MAG: acyl carrier protein [Anaeroplasmataceae bacterium]
MLEKVKDVLAFTLNTDTSKITLKTKLKEDLGIDSLGSAELILEIETQFNIRIEEEEIKKLNTVKDIVDLIKVKKDVTK